MKQLPLYSYSLLILLLSACGILHYWEQEQYRQIARPKNYQNLRCRSDSAQAPVYATSDQSAINQFRPAMDKLASIYHLNFVDMAVAWALLQMYVRPDRVIPGASYQTVIKVQGQPTQYWSFSNSDLKLKNQELPLPFLFGNQYLLKKFAGRHTLSQLANILEQHLNPTIPLFPTSAAQLIIMRPQLQSHPDWAEMFFRGGEIIQAGESYHRPRLKTLFTKDLQKQWSPSHLYQISGPAISSLANSETQCFFPAQNLTTPSNHSHSFFYANAEGEFFFASASFASKQIVPLMKTFFIHGANISALTAICSAQTPSYQLMAFSQGDPLPEQHLQALFSPDLLANLTPNILDQHILGPRQLSLENPHRLLFEVTRANASKVNAMANTPIPVYPIDSLGQIWATFITGHPSAVELFIDTRGPGANSCVRSQKD